MEQARSTLRTADLPTLIYGNLKLTADDGNYPPLQLDKELGLLGNVYQRKSGKPLSDPIPALFTQPAFKHEVDKGIDQAVTQFADDDWVFGANKIDSVQKAQLAQQVLATVRAGLHQGLGRDSRRSRTAADQQHPRTPAPSRRSLPARTRR